MALTQEEIQQVAVQVAEILSASSQGLSEVPVVDSVADIVSLPAIKKVGTIESVVSAPISLLKGKDGREISLRLTETAIQWQYTGGAWGDLITREVLLLPADEAAEEVRKLIDEAQPVIIEVQEAAEEARNAAANVQDGEDGKTTQFEIGLVISAEPGADAEVSLSDAGEDEEGNPIKEINLTLPAGKTGEVPVIEMGTVTTVEPGGSSSATLTPSGVTEEGIPKYILSIVLVKGDTGDIENIYNVSVVFTEAEARENIASGETFAVLFGKIMKWFSGLGTLAFKNAVTWATDITGKPSWIGSSKPIYTKYEVELGNVDNTSDLNKPISTATSNALELKADLVSGKVPSAQLPSYVDDVVEGTLTDIDEFRDVNNNIITPETGKIYVDLATDKQYRWGGSLYTELSKSLGLGEISSTAFPGDRGKALEDNKADKSIKKTSTLVVANWVDISNQSEIEGVNVEGFNYMYPLYDSDFTIDSGIVFVPASNQERLKGHGLYEYSEIVSGDGDCALLIFADILPTEDIVIKLKIEK